MIRCTKRLGIIWCLIQHWLILLIFYFFFRIAESGSELQPLDWPGPGLTGVSGSAPTPHSVPQQNVQFTKSLLEVRPLPHHPRHILQPHPSADQGEFLWLVKTAAPGGSWSARFEAFWCGLSDSAHLPLKPRHSKLAWNWEIQVSSRLSHIRPRLSQDTQGKDSWTFSHPHRPTAWSLRTQAEEDWDHRTIASSDLGGLRGCGEQLWTVIGYQEWWESISVNLTFHKSEITAGECQHS